MHSPSTDPRNKLRSHNYNRAWSGHRPPPLSGQDRYKWTIRGYNRTVCLHNCRVQNHSHPRWRHKNQATGWCGLCIEGKWPSHRNADSSVSGRTGHATDNQESLYLISADQAASVLWKFRFLTPAGHRKDNPPPGCWPAHPWTREENHASPRPDKSGAY